MNRSHLLRGALSCLRDQTEHDIEVLVLDNASTDDTASVFDEEVGKDKRFQYRRQSLAVTALQNFRDALDAVRTDYFLWRADDDLSASNYLEVLANSLDQHNFADLAVSPLKKLSMGADEPKYVGIPDFSGEDAVDRAIFFLKNKRPT